MKTPTLTAHLTAGVLGLIATLADVYGATLYVSLESTNPVPPYGTWATAATNIQDAVDAAKAGDTVLVTNGAYSNPPYAAVEVTKAIRLESVNGPMLTTINGGGVWRCVYLGDNAVLNGFTVTGGYAVRGGGVYCESLGVVTNCVLTGNEVHGLRDGFTVGYGGGAYGGKLYNCTLSDNYSPGEGGGAYQSTLYNCTVTGNSAYKGGGADVCTLINCTLTGNSASYGGGAIWGTLYNCTVTGNGGAYSYGGGGAFESTLYNCTLTGNSAMAKRDEDGLYSGYGGGALFSMLYNCTVTGNSARVGGGGAAGNTLYNCIVYYNTAPNGANYFTGFVPEWGYGASTLLHYSCTTPLPTNGVGNITGPPLFMDMAAGDFRLWESSPCIDAGTNLVGAIVPIWVHVQELRAMSYPYEPTDILGNTRFIDGNADGTVAWDIGAYEFNSFKPPKFTGAPKLTVDEGGHLGWSLNIAGAPNKWVRVQRSSNLKDWEDVDLGWPDGYTVFMGSDGVQQVTDVDAGPKVMFYRAVVR